MFRPLPVYPFRRPRSFSAIAFLSVMTLWGGLSCAQPAPSRWDNASGGASILVTDNVGGPAANQVRLASGCSSVDCYANDNYWQSIGCRTCQTRGCGLGICAGLPCGGCGSGCGVLGGCVTAGNLWSGYCGCRGGLKAKMSGGAQPGLLSSGSLGKLCGKGRDGKQACNNCGEGCGAGCGAGGDGTFCGMPAPNYPVPFRTPAYVGYHQFTYPPMMPHNSLPHYRNVYSFRHGCGGLERTTVNWQPSHIKNALRQIHHMFYLPR